MVGLHAHSGDDIYTLQLLLINFQKLHLHLYLKQFLNYKCNLAPPRVLSTQKNYIEQETGGGIGWAAGKGGV